MAKLAPEDRLAKWLKNHPNASQKKFDKFLSKNSEIASLLVMDTPTTTTTTEVAPEPTPTPTPITFVTTPATPTESGSATDSPGWFRRVSGWLTSHPLTTAAPMVNIGLWAFALALIGWLLTRKKKS
jgi:hypothetical protein